MTTPSAELAAALTEASRVPVCPACADPKNHGLCHSERCRRGVLPVLRLGGRDRQAAHGRFGVSAESLAEIQQRAKKADRPKRRASLKRQVAAHVAKLPPERRGYARLALAIARVPR